MDGERERGRERDYCMGISYILLHTVVFPDPLEAILE